MAQGYESDEEQVEAIKRWWHENGRSVIVGLVLGVAAVVGVRMWLGHTEQQALEASTSYAQLTNELAAGQREAAQQRGQRILQAYSGTGYAALAALSLAKTQAEAGELGDARAQLQWVIDNADQVVLRRLARARLASLLINDGQPQQALNLLESSSAGAFEATYQALKGDAYRAQGQIEAARDAYKVALEGSRGAERSWLKMKLDALAAGA